MNLIYNNLYLNFNIQYCILMCVLASLRIIQVDPGRQTLSLRWFCHNYDHPYKLPYYHTKEIER
jgi:hypothetical protein